VLELSEIGRGIINTRKIIKFGVSIVTVLFLSGCASSFNVSNVKKMDGYTDRVGELSVHMFKTAKIQHKISVSVKSRYKDKIPEIAADNRKRMQELLPKSQTAIPVSVTKALQAKGIKVAPWGESRMSLEFRLSSLDTSTHAGGNTFHHIWYFVVLRDTESNRIVWSGSFMHLVDYRGAEPVRGFQETVEEFSDVLIGQMIKSELL